MPYRLSNSGKEPITRNSKICGPYEILDKVNIKTKYVRALNSLGKKINASALQDIFNIGLMKHKQVIFQIPQEVKKHYA